MERSKYDLLKSRYGRAASWAIWDEKTLCRGCNRFKKAKNCEECMDNNVDRLGSKYVFIALNVSKGVSQSKSNPNETVNWCNFRKGKNDAKLAQIQNYECLKGAYLTDLIKDVVEPKALKLLAKLKDDEGIIKPNIDRLIGELELLGFDAKKDKLVLLGVSTTQDLFYKHFFASLKSRFSITNDNVIAVWHYAYRNANAETWLQYVLQKLGIDT